jgi:hypothetical protein
VTETPPWFARLRENATSSAIRAVGRRIRLGHHLGGWAALGAIPILRASWEDGGDPLLYALIRLCHQVGHRWVWRALLPLIGDSASEAFVGSRLERGEFLPISKPVGNGGSRTWMLSVDPGLEWPRTPGDAHRWLSGTFGIVLQPEVSGFYGRGPSLRVEIMKAKRIFTNRKYIEARAKPWESNAGFARMTTGRNPQPYQDYYDRLGHGRSWTARNWKDQP